MKYASIWARTAVAIAFVAACGGTPPKVDAPEPTETPEPAEEKAEPAEPVDETPKRKSAKEMVAGTESFFFVLADSDPNQAKTAECEKKSKGNEEKLAECTKKLQEAAALEGIRFAPGDEEGTRWWISFGDEKGKEVIFNKVQVKVASEAVDKLTLVPVGKDVGKKPMKKLPAEMVLESPDDKTFVMTDPVKGKLVFRLR